LVSQLSNKLIKPLCDLKTHKATMKFRYMHLLGFLIRSFITSCSRFSVA